MRPGGNRSPASSPAPGRGAAPNRDNTSVAVTNPPHPNVLDGERRPRPHGGPPHSWRRSRHDSGVVESRDRFRARGRRDERGMIRGEARVGQAAGRSRHRLEAGRQGGDGDGRGGNAGTRAGGRPAPPPWAGVRVRVGGRVRVGDQRPADQGAVVNLLAQVQSAGRGSGQGLRKRPGSSSPRTRRARLDPRQSSARATSWARSGLRST